jgi:hypothetical protein
MELKDAGGRVWTEFIWLRIGINGSFCGHGNTFRFQTIL